MRIAPVILTAALLSISTSKTLTAQQNSASGEPEVYQVRPNFYMLNGFGGNIGVQIGRDGVLVVDTGSKGASAKVLEAMVRNRSDISVGQGAPVPGHLSFVIAQNPKDC